MKLLVFLLALLVSSHAYSRDLYLTVYRDFSPKELPEVYIQYKYNAPMQIRILKPKNLKKFITDQIDLRRSWKKPEIKVNPGKYVLRGLNLAKFNVGWIRSVVSKDIRGKNKEFGGGFFKKKGSPIELGPNFLISSPKDFDIVDSFSYIADENDDISLFNVPGYETYFKRYSHTRTKKISLPKLDSGFYVLQVIQGQTEGQVVLVVNDILANLQQSSNIAFVRATSRNGNPLKGASVAVRNLGGKWIAEGKTNKNGVLEFDPKGESDLITVIKDQDHGTAIVDSEFFSTLADAKDVYLYTDRPMYKDNDEVHFKGIIRKKSNGLSSIIDAKKTAKVVYTNLDNSLASKEQDFTINEFGSFTGKYVVSARSGSLHQVQAKVDNDIFSGEFRVKDYVKPLIYIEAKTSKDTLVIGDVVDVNFKVKYYAGGFAKSPQYKWELLRVRTQSKQWVEDDGADEKSYGSMYSHDRSKNVDITIPEIISVSQGYSECQKNNCLLKLDTRMLSAVRPNYDFKYVLKITARDSDSNYTSESISFFNSFFEHNLLVRSSHVYTFVGSKAWVELKAVTQSGKPYPNAKGKVTWHYRSYGENPSLISENVIELDDYGRIKLDIPTISSGQVSMVARVQDSNGKERIVERSFYVVDEKTLGKVSKVSELNLLTRRSYFEVGETAKILVLLPEKWGIENSDKGNLYITVSSSEIEKHYVQKVSGNTAWVNLDITKMFNRVAYVTVSYPSKDFGWILKTIKITIPSKDKALIVKTKPKYNMGTPGEEQEIEIVVKDLNGDPVEAELSVSVVDKSVLSLQPEIRPNILEFFYPTPKFNIMNFFSSDFQGYGYGQKLDYYTSLYKSNHFVSLAKSDGEKLKYKDTAFFDGNVVTNSDGKASVRFKLPANQTIWNVIAVAADKDGRYGEGRSEFVSRMPVLVNWSVPNNIREGDKFDVNVSFASNIDKENPKTKISISSSDVKSDFQFKEIFNGKAKKDFHNVVTNLEQKEVGAKNYVVLKIESEGYKKFLLEMVQTVLPSSITVPHFENFTSSHVKFSTSKHSILEKDKLSVVFTKGITSIVSQATKWLIRYPHGCVEQLINSTIPNIAYYNAFKNLKNQVKVINVYESEFWKDLRSRFSKIVVKYASSYLKVKNLKFTDGEQLEKAYNLGLRGLERLNSYRSGESFTWFSGNGRSNNVMTLYAAMSLAASSDKEIYKKSNLSRIYYYLDGRGWAENSPEGIVLTYIYSYLHLNESLTTSNRVITSNLKSQFLALKKDFTLLEGSLLLQSYANLGLHKSKEHKSIVSELSQLVIKSLDEVVNDDLFKKHRNSIRFRYPGKRNSIMAFALKALHSSRKLDSVIENVVIAELVNSFDGRHFGSTIDTSMVLLNLSWRMQKELEEYRDVLKFDVLLDGKNINKKVDVRNDFNGFYFDVDHSLVKSGGLLELKSKDGKTKLMGKILYHKDVAFKDVKAISDGYSVKRLFHKIDEEKQVLNKKVKSFTKGDLAYIEVDLKRNVPKVIKRSMGSGYSFVTLDLPTGFSPIQEDDLYRTAPFNINLGRSIYSKRLFSKSQVTWYIDETKLSSNKFKLGLIGRFIFSGEFESGVVKIEDFYNEKINGYSDSRTIVVNPK